MPRFDIITIGSAVRDIFLLSPDFQIVKSDKFSTGFGECFSLGSKIEIKEMIFETGGGATNTAVTFSQLGLKTACLAQIGEDHGGEAIIQALKQEGVDTLLMKKIKNKRTSYSIILLTSKGQRTVLVFRGISKLKEKDIPFKKIKKTKWFYLTSLGGNFELFKKIISFAFKNKIKLAINPGKEELKYGYRILKPFFEKIEILILNREEAALLTKINHKKIDKILKAIDFPSILVITDGENGAYARSKNFRYYIPSLKVKVVNSTGAGDAFGSAFTAGMILKNDISYALKLGILNSTSVIQKMGAKNGLLKKLPSKKELSKMKVISKPL